MYYRSALILSAVLFTGCVQMSARYIQGGEYERALVLYENGLLFEARLKALEVRPENRDYKSARKLLYDINTVSLQIARRHMDLGEDYEKAGIYQKAIAEYGASLRYNPSNTLARNRLADLMESMRDGNIDERLKNKRKQQAKEKEDPEYNANLHYMKGKLYFDSKAYGKAIEEFNAVLKEVPSYMNTNELLARSQRQRDNAIEKHLMAGINYFQAEEMEYAIKEWDTVLELDPGNKAATDYKYRAEVILERLKNIREKQENQASQERPL
ncbi:MAG: hypothetical protein Q7T24_05770 [Deltaproteobacteria bacterium]|nr:hypothetical protein [Deltaproteobacteria bacterium]